MSWIVTPSKLILLADGGVVAHQFAAGSTALTGRALSSNVMFLKESSGMAYKKDSGLAFLGKCSDDDLEILVDVITDAATESLTDSDSYQEHYPEHHKYWKEIGEEIQLFGANTVATWFRGGEGVLYKEVVQDVCDKLDVEYSSSTSVPIMERRVLAKILSDSVEKMSKTQLKSLVDDLELNTTDLSKQAVQAAVQAGIKVGGFTAYKASVIVANGVAKSVLGHGLSLAANAGITRTIGVFAGPIGVALTALWAVYDVSGPAYRVTIPCVIHVAFLRAKMAQANKKKSAKISATKKPKRRGA